MMNNRGRVATDRRCRVNHSLCIGRKIEEQVVFCAMVFQYSDYNIGMCIVTYYA